MAVGLRDVVLPWRCARVVYGPYRVAWPGAELPFVPEFPGDEALAGLTERIGLDPLLRRLVPVRAWIGLGLVVFAVKIALESDFGGRVEDALLHAAVTMVLGPYGVFLGALILLVAARGRRAAMLRELTRPLAVAGVTVLLSVGVFGLQLPGVRQYVQAGLAALVPTDPSGGTGVGWWALGLVGGPWLFVFGLCSVYLMHRNGFSAHSHPYLRPILTVWLAGLIAAVELTVSNRDAPPETGVLVATVAGPVVVLVLSAVEVWRLRVLGVAAGEP